MSKRKSMNAGNDAHAINSVGVQPQIYLRSKGFRDACPEKYCVWSTKDPACRLRSPHFINAENAMKRREKQSFRGIFRFCLPDGKG